MPANAPGTLAGPSAIVCATTGMSKRTSTTSPSFHSCATVKYAPALTPASALPLSFTVVPAPAHAGMRNLSGIRPTPSVWLTMRAKSPRG